MMAVMTKRVLKNTSLICPHCETKTQTQIWDYEDECWWWWCELCNDPIKKYKGSQ